MALPLPSPIRDYAAVTWDTQRIAEVITELNALSSVFAPSASAYYVESTNGTGAGTVQTLTTSTTTLLDLNTATTANGGGFNAGADTYTVPVTGIYVAQLHVRIADSAAFCNIGLQVHDSSTLGSYTGWSQHVAAGSGGTRHSFQYLRPASWSAGTVLRTYAFQDSGANLALTMIFFSIWRIG